MQRRARGPLIACFVRLIGTLLCSPPRQRADLLELGMSDHGVSAESLRRVLQKSHLGLTLDKARLTKERQTHSNVLLGVQMMRASPRLQQWTSHVGTDAPDEVIQAMLTKEEDDAPHVAHLAALDVRIESHAARLTALEEFLPLSDYALVDRGVEITGLIFDLTRNITSSMEPSYARDRTTSGASDPPRSGAALRKTVTAVLADVCEERADRLQAHCDVMLARINRKEKRWLRLMQRNARSRQALAAEDGLKLAIHSQDAKDEDSFQLACEAHAEKDKWLGETIVPLKGFLANTDEQLLRGATTIDEVLDGIACLLI
jgi:hypothetical protein